MIGRWDCPRSDPLQRKMSGGLVFPLSPATTTQGHPMQERATLLLLCSLIAQPAFALGDNPASTPKDQSSPAKREDQTKIEKAQQLIIGQWEVVEGPAKGGFMVFTKEGTMSNTKDGTKPPLPKNPSPAEVANHATIQKYKLVSDSELQIDIMLPIAQAVLLERGPFGRPLTAEEEKKLEKLTKQGVLVCTQSHKVKITLNKAELTMKSDDSDEIVKLKKIK